MSQNIAAWYREVIKDKVTLQYQANGGLLDGTMMGGDTQAGTVKFPIAGRSEVYKLTGAIERVPVNGPSLTTVPLQMDDFETSDFWRTQDAYRAGPNEQQALVELQLKAIRRKRDTIKTDALAAFAATNGEVTTIGDGTKVIDIVDVEQARAQIAGTGGDDEIFLLLPAMWMSQMKFYKEVADAQFAGPGNTVWSERQRLKMRTVQGVHWIEGPDEYFKDGTGGVGQFAYMWGHDTMGAEMPLPEKAPDITPQPMMQGTPYLVKNALSGAAIGIQPKGVKRLWFQKQTRPVRPAVVTTTV